MEIGDSYGHKADTHCWVVQWRKNCNSRHTNWEAGQ